MAEVSDIEVYQKLSELADDLEMLAARGASLVGEVALSTAARTVRGMATAVYQHIMAERDTAARDH
jgi:hypothetical protein